MTDLEFIKTCYQVILQRDGDEQGIQHYAKMLENGMWRKQIVEIFTQSAEFQTLGSEPLFHRLHHSRMKWIESHVPNAQLSLDIGGSSRIVKEGAIFELGWQGKPKTHVIIDLPPDEQYWGTPKYSQFQKYETVWGGMVEYFHSTAEDIQKISGIQDRRFDLIFMGQVIEHLDPDKLTSVLEWIHMHLSPGGKLCIDTPNRSATVLHSPNSWIDPDHKHEFTAVELEDLLQNSGFNIVTKCGIMPVPESIRSSTWNPIETFHLSPLTESPAEGYVLAYTCEPK